VRRFLILSIVNSMHPIKANDNLGYNGSLFQEYTVWASSVVDHGKGCQQAAFQHSAVFRGYNHFVKGAAQGRGY